MPAKTKTQQKENLTEAHGRDLFQTPNYAIDLLDPFLKNIKARYIWEPAAGLGKIVKRLEYFGYKVHATDINDNWGAPVNFLTERLTFVDHDPVIVTNTPFSLKKKFYEQCLSYGFPFALLLPADYSGWIIEACQNGAEKIIPTRRIDYITPNVLQRIHEGEIWETFVHPQYPQYKTLKSFTFDCRSLWDALEFKYHNFRNFESIYDVPAYLLRKYSSSDFHSMWLTMGFNIGKQETFVELTNEEKDNI